VKKRLGLKKVTIRDLDESVLKEMAGGATEQTWCDQATCSSTCPNSCNGTCDSCNGTCGTCDGTCQATCFGDTCGCGTQLTCNPPQSCQYTGCGTCC
jgi:hypothetical protein